MQVMVYLACTLVFVSVLLFLLGYRMHKSESSWMAVRHRVKRENKDSVEQDIWAAGLKTDRTQVLAAALIGAVGGAVAVYAVTGMMNLAPIGFAAGIIAPRLWLNRLVAGRARAFESGFQLALSQMASSLRAGQNIEQALEQAALSAEGPTREVLGLVVHLRRSGDSVPQALEKAGAFVKSPSLDMMAAATVLHMQTGGDLAAVYDQIADSIRDREAFKAQVQSATSEGRMTGNILVIIPFAFVGMLRALSPEYMAPLFAPQGLVIMAFCTVMVLVGYLILQCIVDIEY